jgi:hypothetical protein
MKAGMVNKGHLDDAEVMEKASGLLRDLHIINDQCLKENTAIKQSLKHHFAGLAMSTLLSVNRDDCLKTTCQKAYGIADAMVKYGEEESKVKRTEDGVGGASTDHKDS